MVFDGSLFLIMRASSNETSIVFLSLGVFGVFSP